MAATGYMTGAHRSAVWGFIALLAVLAFLRSLAPERTEKAVRRLLTARDASKDASNAGEGELAALKEELQRERVALERWKEQLDRQRKELSNASAAVASRASEEIGKTADETGLIPKEEDPDAFTDMTRSDIKKHVVGTGGGDSATDQSSPATDEVSGVTDGESAQEEVDDVVPVLSEDECPNIVVPEYAKAGLGTQIGHIWSSLSLTLAIRNACMVIPPVVSDDGTGNFRPVPFDQVFDTDLLSSTGLRFVPLRTCEKHGVSTVFDDIGASSAIVKNFAAFVQETHPMLARRSTLVHGDAKGIRFPNASEVNGDVNTVAHYVRSNLPEEPGRHCIGIGRMRAKVEINPDVLQFFTSAPSVSDYVTAKFPHANETLFVKLRWNRAHCDKTRTEDGTVCIFSDNVVSVDEYVFAIAYAAKEAGAQSIYIATPSHIPDDVSSYLASNLVALDPILLDVDGDIFTANIVERELAVRARRFIPDGGAWGDSVQLSREKQFPALFTDDMNSLKVIQDWKNAGWPKDSPMLKNLQPSGEAIEQSNDVLSGYGEESTRDENQSTEDSMQFGQGGGTAHGNWTEGALVQGSAVSTENKGRTEEEHATPPENHEQGQPKARQEADSENTSQPEIQKQFNTEFRQGVGIDAVVEERQTADALEQGPSGARHGKSTTRRPDILEVPSELHASSGLDTAESRPAEYVPPADYVPSDDTDDEMEAILAQRSETQLLTYQKRLASLHDQPADASQSLVSTGLDSESELGAPGEAEGLETENSMKLVRERQLQIPCMVAEREGGVIRPK